MGSEAAFTGIVHRLIIARIIGIIPDNPSSFLRVFFPGILQEFPALEGQLTINFPPFVPPLKFIKQWTLFSNSYPLFSRCACNYFVTPLIYIKAQVSGQSISD
jgi:hypothetical protein